MSHVLDRIVEEVRGLPPNERQLLSEMLFREQHLAERSRRAALSRQIRGKYAHLPTSSEDFARRKTEEIVMEDRRSRA